MTYRFHRAALAELRAQARWYDDRYRGLGDTFVRATERVLDRALKLPRAPAAYDAESGARRLRVPGFPVAVLYVERTEELLIVAVAHERRRPGYWRGRL